MEYAIELNFLPLKSDIPSFRVFRKPRGANEARPQRQDIAAYSLPKTSSDADERAEYWVSFEELPEFESFVVLPHWNRNLTKWALLWSVRDAAMKALDPSDYALPERGFWREVRFKIQRHPEGDEELVVQPYFLRSTEQFGFLVDFHFRRRPHIPFSRRIQVLSLSLDKNFRRNLNFYMDRLSKMKQFVHKRWDVLGNLRLAGSDAALDLSLSFKPVDADRLQSKVYVFGDGGKSKSQFNGLLEFGPLQPLSEPPTLLFVFREQDRQAARTLAVALRGPRQPNKLSFPGFERLFRSELRIDSNPVVVDDFSYQAAQQVLDRTLTAERLLLPVFILPDSESPGYLEHKALFAQRGIATQACTLPIIQDESSLRWSVANIALQLFCKAGGHPWKVHAQTNNALIIGISQSHKVRMDSGRTTVDRYFAFSVLTDSSGLFQKIQVLGEGADQGEYLGLLRRNLSFLLRDCSRHFSRIVIHTSFRLRMSEIEAIRKTVQQVATGEVSNGCEFAVVKVNERNRFFGVNPQAHSLVPYEGTKVRLGAGEYLVWFEGIFPDRPTVTKVFPGPTHIEFLKVTDQSKTGDHALLQDLVNLSGANWRGFNAKSAPVSVFYCHIIADMVQEFNDAALPMPAVEQLRPWFL